jgi:hypothetical protein
VLPLAAVFTAFFLAVMVVEGESRPTSQAHRQDVARKVKRTQSPQQVSSDNPAWFRQCFPVEAHLYACRSPYPLTLVPVPSHPYRAWSPRKLTRHPVEAHLDPCKASPRSPQTLTGIGFPRIQCLQVFKVFTS